MNVTVVGNWIVVFLQVQSTWCAARRRTKLQMLKSSLSRSFRFRLKSRHHHHFVSSNKRFFFASFTTNNAASASAPRRKLHCSSYNLYSHFSVSGGGLNPRRALISVFNNIRSMSSSETSSSVVENVVTTGDGVQQAELILGAFEDDHGGVIVEIKKPMDPEIFLSSLRASMSHWKQQGKKGVWIKLPIELVNLVEAAVNEGFWYHHAEPKYLMLVYWIPETINTLPANATHRVGIGAFVINDKREILVVQENSGVFRGTGVWKFPTGVINEGEDLSIGAVREVKEETGIDTEFVEVLAFMQSHKSFFDKSDLFFVCMLRPLSFDIQKQELEIEAAQWMPIEEFAAQPLAQKQGLLKNMIDIGLAKLDNAYTGFSPVPTALSFSNHRSSLYLNTRDLNLKP